MTDSDAAQPPEDDLIVQDTESSGYSRVTAEKAFAIVQLRKAFPNITGQEIAAKLEMHPSTVSRWLRLLSTDTVKEARQVAKAQALRATLKISDQVDHDDPRVSLGASKAIVALAGVQEGTAQVSVGVQVVVGASGAPAGPDPFDN